MWKLKTDLPFAAAVLFILYMLGPYSDNKTKQEKPPAPLDTMVIEGHVFLHPPDSAFKWIGPVDTVTKRKAKFR